MKVRRPYRMLARAETAAATGARILRAATEMVWEQPDVTLEAVATRAGVSVQTVIRAFGGRAALIDAAAQAAREEIEAERSSALPGNVAASVRVLFDHYERIGDRVVAILGMERRLPPPAGGHHACRFRLRPVAAHRFCRLDPRRRGHATAQGDDAGRFRRSR